MSIRRSPRRRCARAARRRPPARGPRQNAPRARRAASSAGTTPPEDCITSGSGARARSPSPRAGRDSGRAGGEIGVDHGRGAALVLAELRQYLVRRGDVDPGNRLADPRRERRLVAWVEIREQEAYRDRLRAGRPGRRSTAPSIRWVLEWLDHAPRPGPLGDPDPQIRRCERLGRRRAEVIQARACLAGDLEQIGEAFGRDQRGARAPLLEQRVGPHRHPVRERARCRPRPRRALEHRLDRGDHPARSRSRRRRRLGGVEPVPSWSTASVNVPPTSTPSSISPGVRARARINFPPTHPYRASLLHRPTAIPAAQAARSTSTRRSGRSGCPRRSPSSRRASGTRLSSAEGTPSPQPRTLHAPGSRSRAGASNTSAARAALGSRSRRRATWSARLRAVVGMLDGDRGAGDDLRRRLVLLDPNAWWLRSPTAPHSRGSPTTSEPSLTCARTGSRSRTSAVPSPTRRPSAAPGACFAKPPRRHLEAPVPDPGGDRGAARRRGADLDRVRVDRGHDRPLRRRPAARARSSARA